MGKWVHRVTNVDAVHMVGDCEHCGVGVPLAMDHQRHACAAARIAQRGGPNRAGETRRSRALKALPVIPTLCEICGTDPGYPLYLDHDHATGEARGWLCSLCNLGLGHFKDEPARMLAAAQYIQKSRNQ